jgi:UDPglucose 6-dehydrogenase
MNSVTVVGTGYVGLVTGTCLSEFGLQVVCMDTDTQKVQSLAEGRVPIYEPGLDQLVAKNVASGRLRFTDDIAEAVAASPVIFIAVPTPTNEDGSADLKHVLAAAEAIAHNMAEQKIIVNKSTVPVGTGRKVKEAIRSILGGRGLTLEFDVVSNPEFLREGAAIRDFMHPDRILIGGDSPESCETVRDIYNVLYLIETPFIFTSLETAELVKYASNAFLATKIAFINEVANLCDRVQADIRDVAMAMGMDGRIGKYFLHPGPGFGGSCLPKDTKALVKIGQNHGVRMSIVDAVVKANDHQRHHLAQKIETSLGGLDGKVIAALGLAFKQGTDDIRESPAVSIVAELIQKGGRIKVYDPRAMENAKKHAFAGLPCVESAEYDEAALGDFGISLFKIMFCTDEYVAVAGADAVVVLTEWNQFRHMDLPRISASMRGRHFFDFRNLYEPEDLVKYGFNYESVGQARF